MKSKILIFIFFLYLMPWLQAQQISSYVISSGSLSGTNIGSTAGESVIGTSSKTFQLFSGFNFISNTDQTTNIPIDETLKIYPTIVKDNIHIRGEYIWLKIYDTQGYMRKHISSTSNINVSNLPSGIYIVTIKTANKVFIKKILKL